MSEERIDRALVGRGLAVSRTAAAQAVSAGRVRVAGRVVQRPSARVRPDQPVDVAPGDGWVGRAAEKLDAALDAFGGVRVAGRDALDLGASTGGFTQVLLGRGARQVLAVDVGHDQLAPGLRSDPRVVVAEGENARDLDPAQYRALAGVDAAPGVIVADLSFISLRLVLPAVAAVLADDGDVVVLIKPQFEVGRERVHGGVVRSGTDRASAVRGVLDAARSVGLRTAGLIASPMPGRHGNREVLAHLHRSRGSDPAEWQRSIEDVVRPDREAR